MSQEAFEVGFVVVFAVDTVYLARYGGEDQVVVVAGAVVVSEVAPVFAFISDTIIVEFLVAALCGTRYKALVIVPVVGPTVEWSLWHFRIRLERGVVWERSSIRGRGRAWIDPLTVSETM